jgi:hypothetical protein
VYFFNARLRFKIPAVITPISGSVIAASSISPIDLQRRPFTEHVHLTRRLLDPQLYMASVDPAIDSETVARLAAYPWFHGHGVPKYDSGQYVNRKEWKKTHEPGLVSQWTRTIPTEPSAIRKAARAAVDFQLKLGCDAILLPGPLTTIVDQSLQNELTWLDAGLEACNAAKAKCQAFATIALSEAVLQVPALKNPLIHSLSNQVATRTGLAGAYIVLEQSDSNNYFWTSKDALMSLLILIDDLYRGASKKVVVNYVGTFGLVAKAVGAEIWSSGYFLMQRRFSLKGVMGIAYPRYHSLALAGDIGLKEDLERINRAGLADECMTPTDADAVLRAALKKGKKPPDVPEWEYRQNNWPAAQRHYLEIASTAGSKLEKMSIVERQNWVHIWLKNAVNLVNALKTEKLVGIGTTTDHQRVWMDVFEDWRSYAKQ